MLVVVDLTWSGELAFGERESKEPNVTLRSMNGGRDITKSYKNAGKPWQR